MTVERTVLPGVGVAHAITTRASQRAGVVCHLDGRREIVLYDPEDGERAICLLVLEADEAHRVADLLSATVTVDRLAELEQELTGVIAARVRLPAGSPFDGRPLGETRARSRTGVSIVAVVRDGEVIVGPAPGFVLRCGDLLAVVGARGAVADLVALLT
ncbi:TrkA C-terminal domain-containing protein [Actinoplanes sp. NPDC024001]|uniref:cation:proton antiporter regulatory subunit n=1 Tax=Actinoplanes sp. NPDC024001 TaxID=3154598 RepID=UPI0033F70EC4